VQKNWLPHQSFLLRTHLSAKETVERMALALKPPPHWKPFVGGDGSFYGITDEEGFWIRRNIPHQNSFRPTLRGIIEDRHGNTFIRCNLRMDTAVLIFLIVWITILAVVASATLPLNCPGNCLEASVPVAMLALGMLLLVLFGYWPEAKRVRRFVSETLSAQDVPQF
jgi:hypothetical protein